MSFTMIVGLSIVFFFIYFVISFVLAMMSKLVSMVVFKEKKFFDQKLINFHHEHMLAIIAFSVIYSSYEVNGFLLMICCYIVSSIIVAIVNRKESKNKNKEVQEENK